MDKLIVMPTSAHIIFNLSYQNDHNKEKGYHNDN